MTSCADAELGQVELWIAGARRRSRGSKHGVVFADSAFPVVRTDTPWTCVVARLAAVRVIRVEVWHAAACTIRLDDCVLVAGDALIWRSSVAGVAGSMADDAVGVQVVVACGAGALSS